MILYRHHTHKLLSADGSMTLSTSSGTIMYYATTSCPTDLPASNGRSLIHHSITLGDGESSDRLVLRNVLINYLIANTQNRIIALNPKHNHYQNKGNLLANLTPKLHPDISTKHKYMTFLLSYNTPRKSACNSLIEMSGSVLNKNVRLLPSLRLTLLRGEDGGDPDHEHKRTTTAASHRPDTPLR